ncbi:MAG: hypothetical protein ACYS7Y_33980, partial [Planctomycetota bacterium]
MTICDGIGFVLYKVGLTMMLAGMTPDALAESSVKYASLVTPGPLGILAYTGGGRLTAHMFEIP